MLSGRQAWQLPSRWRLHSHWHTHVSADLLKGFDSTCPERHRLIRWWWVSSARAGLIRTIVTAHQPVARWRVRTEVFALMIWSRSTSGDFGKFISKSLARANSGGAFRATLTSSVRSSRRSRLGRIRARSHVPDAGAQLPKLPDARAVLAPRSEHTIRTRARELGRRAN